MQNQTINTQYVKSKYNQPISDTTPENNIKDTIQIFLPSTKNINQPLTIAEQQALKINAGEHFTKLYGGCTFYKAEGFYKIEEKQIIEDITICETFLTISEKVIKDLRTYAKKIKNAYTQESILIKYNNRVEFI